MSNQEQAQTRQDIQARIITKAWKDEAYKQELLTNPKAVIEREFGVEFPADVNVIINEEKSNHLYFVLPMRPHIEGRELSEEELESVSGGFISAVITISLAASPYTKPIAKSIANVSRKIL